MNGGWNVPDYSDCCGFPPVEYEGQLPLFETGGPVVPVPEKLVDHEACFLVTINGRNVGFTTDIEAPFTTARDADRSDVLNAFTLLGEWSSAQQIASTVVQQLSALREDTPEERLRRKAAERGLV